MEGLAEHWDGIFAAKDDPQLGWYEADVSQSLRFFDRVAGSPGATVFLPGAGTSALVDELLARGARLVIDDISAEALAKLARRIGERDPAPVWLRHDISRPLPPGLPACDVWLDRAVLHFLTEEAAIAGYFDNLRTVLRPGGHVILAEFAESGAEKCAGLAVRRYSVAEMARRLGPEFTLVDAEDFLFVSPSGAPRPYVYASFRRARAPA